MEIKPLAQIADKWVSRAAVSGQAYTDGVTSPRRPWAASAAAADDARKAGLAQADAADSFRKGVTAAGDAKWSSRARALGPARFTQGVGVAKPEFQSGFTKYHGVISSLVLPPRGAKGSPENINRVSVLAAALHSAKVSG